MARDANGNYTLPSPAFVRDVIADPAAVNANFSDIAAALSDSMTRTGVGALEADLAAGGYKVTGLAAGTAVGDAVRHGQVGWELLDQVAVPPTGQFAVGFTLPAGWASFRIEAADVSAHLYNADTFLAAQFSIDGGVSFQNQVFNNPSLLRQGVRTDGPAATDTSGWAYLTPAVNGLNANEHDFEMTLNRGGAYFRSRGTSNGSGTSSGGGMGDLSNSGFVTTPASIVQVNIAFAGGAAMSSGNLWLLGRKGA